MAATTSPPMTKTYLSTGTTKALTDPTNHTHQCDKEGGGGGLKTVQRGVHEGY
jgi:hypothetical protein